MHKERVKPDEETAEDTHLLGELGHLFLVDFLSFYELRGKILSDQVLH